ncbi:MAG: SRPBCC family protein [Bacteroidetes bacterium]|nr:SRPBCC family protein [Bacteroidota bacterium]
MKIVKIVLGVILGLLLTLAVIGVVSPKEAVVTRSTVVAAPMEIVWAQVSSLEKQHDWSPWARRDPNMEFNFEGPTGEIGSKYMWSGNEDVGSGSQLITAIEVGKRIEQDLTFLTPWENTAKVWIALDQAEEGIKVEWGFKTDLGFIGAIFNRFMSMDAELGPDFEEGLGYLNEICAAEANKPNDVILRTVEVDGIEVQEKPWEGNTYVGIRKELAWSELQGFFSDSYKAIGGLLAQAGYETAGGPTALYFEWDEANQRTDVAAVMAVKATEISLEGLETFSVGGGLTCQVLHKGPYEDVGGAHTAIDKHMKANGFYYEMAIEEYLNDPVTVSSPSEYLTLITYPVTIDPNKK